MDFNRAIGAPFKDEKWIGKAALGGLWMLLLVTTPALIGWALEYTKRTAEGSDEPMPEWSDFGSLWVRGFLAYVASFVYSLPALLIIGFAMIPLFGAIAAAQAGGEQTAGAALSAGFMGACFFYVIALVYLVFISFFVLGALANYAVKGNFGALFEVGTIWGKMRSGSGFLGAWGVWFLAAIVMSLITGTISGILNIIPVIGTLAGVYIGGVGTFIAYAMGFEALGQYAAAAYGMPGPLAGAGAYAAPVGAASAPVPAPPAPPAAPAPPAPPAPPAAAAAPEPPAAPPAAPAAPEPPAPPAPPAG